MLMTIEEAFIEYHLLAMIRGKDLKRHDEPDYGIHLALASSHHVASNDLFAVAWLLICFAPHPPYQRGSPQPRSFPPHLHP